MTRASVAWAARATAPFVMMHDGDSVTEGTGASGFEGKWTTKLLRSLQADAAISGGPGFVNSGSYSPSSNSLSTFYNPVPSVQTAGLLGNRVGGGLANDQAVTFAFTGTSFDLHFMQGYTAALAMTVTIDGGTPQTVPIRTTSQDFKGLWHSPVVAHGAHTAVITPGTGQAIHLQGVYVYDGDEGKGVHGYEGGHFGSTSTDHATATAAYYTQAVSLLQPALVTIFLGLNDMSTGVAPATYQSNLDTIIAAINAAATVAPSYVICGPYLRVSNPATTYPLSQYTAAGQAVVAEDAANRRFVDLSQAGLVNGTDFFDDVHPNDGGHTKLAAAIRPAVLDLAGASAPPPSAWTALAAERWTGSAWVPLVAEEWTGTAWTPATMERAT